MLRCAGGHAFDVAKEGYVHLAKRTRASAEQQAESDEVVQLVEHGYAAGFLGWGSLSWLLVVMRTKNEQLRAQWEAAVRAVRPGPRRRSCGVHKP